MSTYGGDMDYKTMWENLSDYIDTVVDINKRAKLQTVFGIIKAYKDKVWRVNVRKSKWLTTGEVTKKYKVKRQALHKCKMLNPRKVHERKVLWDENEVIAWRESVAKKMGYKDAMV